MAKKGNDYFKQVATRRRPIDAILSPVTRLIQEDAAGGIVLIIATAAALILANSGLAESFGALWMETNISIHIDSWEFPKGSHKGHLQWWINDALMAAFFFVIGLEIKREFLAGELANPKAAALPLVAALGGMAIPGAIYAVMTWGTDALRGWAIPAATDIAFALGMLALMRRHAPPGLRVFLVTLAIADDLGALVIIAIFYTDQGHLELSFLGWAGVMLAIMIGLNALHVRLWWVYGLVGLALWYCVLESGVHATIAGVLGALAIPARIRIDPHEFTRQARRLANKFDTMSDGEAGDNDKPVALSNQERRSVLRAMEQITESAQTPLERLENTMFPLVTFGVVPIFAFANAGVSIGDVAAKASTDRSAWAIVIGLVVGKAGGIFGASYLAVRTGLAKLPAGVSWRHMFGAAMLGGIGFTMSLFIAHLAFGGSERLEIAKFAVLTGSVIAAATGCIILATCKRQEGSSQESKPHTRKQGDRA